MMPLPPGAEGEAKFNCTECNRLLRAPPALAGQVIECPRCKAKVLVPHSEGIQPAGAGYPSRDNPYGLSEADRAAFERFRQQAPPPEGGLSSTAIGWIVFILIFGVGNFILYATTGIFLIPIPRR